jgi:hypothetical protein
MLEAITARVQSSVLSLEVWGTIIVASFPLRRLTRI